MIEICKKEDCVGCGACMSVCNKEAVSMHPDELGFLYPEIDQSKCVDCGLCVKSCLNNCKPIYNEPIEACVGHAVDIKEQISSTSGGLASVFMRKILEKGGVVYACSGENACNVRHIRIESPKDIEKLKGSKYVQSYMGQTYKAVCADVKNKSIVLFIGTPCQVAGLKAYLGGKDTGNLLTVDFVCHGVPSQQLLNDAIDAKIKNNKNLRLVNRVKEGKRWYTFRLIRDGKIVLDEPYPSMGYITGFLRGLYYRENCYHCKFARRERVSDVTLGDFWDRYDNIKDLSNKSYGLSMIMINTEVGQNLLNSCRNLCEKIEWNYEDFIRRNSQLKQPYKRHPKRDLFAQKYIKFGYEVALKETLCEDLKNIRKNLFLNAISERINRTSIGRFLYRKLRKR